MSFSIHPKAELEKQLNQQFKLNLSVGTLLKQFPKMHCLIDLASGEKRIEQQEFSLPGVLPLIWNRFYLSHQSDKDLGMGYGWRSNFDLELFETEEQVSLTDEKGNVFEFNRPAIQTQCSDEAGMYFLYRYDQNEYILTDRDNSRWIFKPMAGRWRPVKLHDLFSNTLNLIYNEKHQLIRIESSHCRALLMKRDEVGHIIKITPAIVQAGTEKSNSSRQFDPIEEAAVCYSYNHLGEMIGVSKAQNSIEKFEYQTRKLQQGSLHLMSGRVLKDESQLQFEWQSNETRYHCVSLKNVSMQSCYVLEFETDEMRAKCVLPNGSFEVYQYNTEKQLVSYQNSLKAKVELSYSDNNLQSVIDHFGNRQVFQYDRLSRLVSIQDAAGNLKKIKYNQQNNPVAIVDQVNAVWQQEFDLLGRLIKLTDPLNRKTLFKYQEDGQLIKIIYADGSFTQFKWNLMGELVRLTDEKSFQYHFNYNELGQINQILLPDKKVIHYAYHVTGEVAGISYYPFSQQTNEYSLKDSAKDADDRLQNWLFNYDKAGRLIEFIDPEQQTIQWKYQAGESHYEKTDLQGHKTLYELDWNGNLLAVINHKNQLFRFVYDNNQQLIQSTDFQGNSNQYQYNQQGLLVNLLQGENKKQYFEYNSIGQIIKKVSFDKQNNQSEQSVYEYDLCGRLCRANNSARKIKFEYDAAGQISEEWQDRVQTCYQYDKRGRKSSVISPSEDTLNYQYDPVGQVEKILLNEQGVVQFKRDPMGRLLSVDFSQQPSNQQLKSDRKIDFGGKVSGLNLLSEYPYAANNLMQCNSDGFYSAQTDTVCLQPAGLSDFDGCDDFKEFRKLIFEQIFAGTQVSESMIDSAFYKTASSESLLNRFFNGRMNKYCASRLIQPSISAKEQLRQIKKREQLEACFSHLKLATRFEYDDCNNLVKLVLADQTAKINSFAYNSENQLIQSRIKGLRTDYQYDALARCAQKCDKTGTTTFFWSGDLLQKECKDYQVVTNIFDFHTGQMIAQLKDHALVFQAIESAAALNN